MAHQTTLAAALAAPVTVSPAVHAGALAVFPLIAGAAPRTRYLGFAAAQAAGLAVTELEHGAAVGALGVANPLDLPVLLYEGEEVLGAMQNRTFEQSVLLAPRSRQRVPVSCVEAGRWEGRRRRERFTPAPQAAHPELRRRRAAALRDGRPAQEEVWAEVAEKADRMAARSDTGALHDVYEARRGELRAIQSAFSMCCSQVGALVAIGGRFVVLDHVSDVEAFATLHDRLVAGYALDALEAPADASPPSLDDAREFLALLLRAEPAAAPAAGLGESLRFAFGGLAGSALVHDGELVALTAYA